MTREAVGQAVKTLQATGQVVSIRRVRKLLGGGSFRDLLPLLQNQHDGPGDPLYQRVVDMVTDIEATLASRRYGQLPGVIARGEETWRACVPAMHAASARGEPTQAWAEAFERLRVALATAIVQQAVSPRIK